MEWTGDRSCKFLAQALKSQANHSLHLEDHEEESGLPTLEQYIEANMTMLEEVLPKKTAGCKLKIHIYQNLKRNKFQI